MVLKLAGAALPSADAPGEVDGTGCLVPCEHETVSSVVARKTEAMGVRTNPMRRLWNSACRWVGDETARLASPRAPVEPSLIPERLGIRSERALIG